MLTYSEQDNATFVQITKEHFGTLCQTHDDFWECLSKLEDTFDRYRVDCAITVKGDRAIISLGGQVSQEKFDWCWEMTFK